MPNLSIRLFDGGGGVPPCQKCLVFKAYYRKVAMFHRKKKKMFHRKKISFCLKLFNCSSPSVRPG